MLHNSSSIYSDDRFKTLPKVELHRHLEGSVRLGTLIEIGQSYGMDVPDTGKLRELVQINEHEEYTFNNFLSKFQTLRHFYRSPEIIERITLEAIEDAALDNIRYLELRFTPVALSRAEGFSIEEVIDWVIISAKKGDHQFGVLTRLIVSVNRNEEINLASKVVSTAIDNIKNGIVGIDLAGDEANFSGMDFVHVFKQAKEAGLNITIHAGEWSGPENVSNAILHLGADRIGHGVRVIEDPYVVQLARDRNIPFEVCITSNYQSGVVDLNDTHPISRMRALGLNTTINTDDPSISQITLSDEYQLACNIIGFSFIDLKEQIKSAASYSFLSSNEKQKLIKSLTAELG